MDQKRVAAVSFEAAMKKYEAAKRRLANARGEVARDKAIWGLDIALNFLLACQSPDLLAFGEKMEILECEYGLEPQRRHMASVYDDARQMKIDALDPDPGAAG